MASFPRGVSAISLRFLPRSIDICPRGVRTRLKGKKILVKAMNKHISLEPIAMQILIEYNTG